MVDYIEQYSYYRAEKQNQLLECVCKGKLNADCKCIQNESMLQYSNAEELNKTAY
jgi:hypothetical protein